MFDLFDLVTETVSVYKDRGRKRDECVFGNSFYFNLNSLYD